jgi:hypothetical protein
MKKRITIGLLILGVSVNAFAHASSSLHFDDAEAVFSGYGDDKSFKELFKVVSGGIDNDLPKMFRETIGPVPGNHRILGHGWTLNAAIPKKTMDKLLAKYPDKKDEIIALWAVFARNCIAKAEELTGLPKNQAKALASMIYDVHLIGDWGPKNKLLDDVLALDEIVNNFKKDCEVLFINKPVHSEFVSKKLDEAMKSKLPVQEKAQFVMDALYALRLGTMLNDAWGSNLKFKYSADANVSARGRVSEKTAKPDTKVVESTQLYRVSASGKIHNSTCQYYEGKGPLTDKPIGENCKKCGGTAK